MFYIFSALYFVKKNILSSKNNTFALDCFAYELFHTRDYVIINRNRLCKLLNFTFQRRTLDLRYNEMWNDWDNTYEQQMPKKFIHGHLVLSWKKINVQVKQTTKTFFHGSKTSYKQILHNGE